MDALPQFGTAISDIVGPTYEVYRPLLLAQAESIKSTPRDTHAYGPHPRQKLDVYHPSADAATGANAVLIFLYGGGLVRGQKSNDDFINGLVYTNLGHYFTERLGFDVIVPDYRLISHGAAFPSGGEDLRLALDWTLHNYGASQSKPLEIFLMGNSAGGVHVSTYLFSPEFAKSRQEMLFSDASKASLRGVILLSVPFHFDSAVASRSEVLNAYFGKEVKKRCPMGLLRTATQEGTIKDLEGVSILVLKGSLDPEDEMLIPIADFVDEVRQNAALSSHLRVHTMEGHNHISPVLALGTAIPKEEIWGQEVVEFVRGSLST